jgi:hypothetical protein
MLGQVRKKLNIKKKYINTNSKLKKENTDRALQLATSYLSQRYFGKMSSAI